MISVCISNPFPRGIKLIFNDYFHWALRLEFRPCDWELSLGVGIWALMLGFEFQKRGQTEEKKRKNENKFQFSLCMWEDGDLSLGGIDEGEDEEEIFPSGPLPKNFRIMILFFDIVLYTVLIYCLIRITPLV